MSEVSYTDCILLFYVGEEGTFVVDFEVEDAMLVRQFKGGGVEGRVGAGEGHRGRGEVDSPERGQHGEF